MGISEEYERNNELNEALDFAQQSLTLSEKNDYKKGITFAYLQLSEIHGKLGNKSQQRKFKRKGNNAFEKINTTIGNDLANLNKQQLLAEEQLKKQQQAADVQIFVKHLHTLKNFWFFKGVLYPQNPNINWQWDNQKLAFL